MRHQRKLFAFVLAVPVAASSAWVDDEASHCQIEVRSSVPGEVFRWSGGCTSGKAEGQGVLTSSHGAFLKGQYENGRPLNAYGRWAIPRLYGKGPVVPWYLTYRNGEALVEPMKLPGPHERLESISASVLNGRWKLESHDGSCAEIHEFNRNGTLTVESGKEVLESSFGVLKVEGHPTKLVLLGTTIRSNGEPDCTGSVTPIDRSVVDYVEIVDDNTIHICSVGVPSKCGATARRVTR